MNLQTMKRKRNQKEILLTTIWTLIMTIAIPTLFTSCGDDKEENGIDERLMGTWHYTMGNIWEYKNDILVAHWQIIDDKRERVYKVENGKETGEYYDFENVDNNSYHEELTFNSNGTVVSTDYQGVTTPFKFKASNGTMTFTLDQGEVVSLQYEITDDQLVITSDNRKKYDKEGYSDYSINYYQRGGYLKE